MNIVYIKCKSINHYAPYNGLTFAKWIVIGCCSLEEFAIYFLNCLVKQWLVFNGILITSALYIFITSICTSHYVFYKIRDILTTTICISFLVYSSQWHLNLHNEQLQSCNGNGAQRGFMESKGFIWLVLEIHLARHIAAIFFFKWSSVYDQLPYKFYISADLRTKLMKSHCYVHQSWAK